MLLKGKIRNSQSILEKSKKYQGQIGQTILHEEREMRLIGLMAIDVKVKRDQEEVEPDQLSNESI